MMGRRRLIWQLYPSYLLLVLLALLATGWYASRAMRLFHLDQVHEDLRHQAHFLVPQIEPLLAPLQGAALDALCKRLGRDVPTRITVVLPDGAVAADSQADPAAMENHGGRAEIVQALAGRTGTAVRFSGTINQHMMYLAVPVGETGGQAVVRLAVALTAVEQQLRVLQVRIGAGGVVIAVLASLVCLLISRRISRPIEAMRQGAARFAAGDLTHRLVPPDTEELAGLAKAMNKMAVDLEERIQTVVRQRNEAAAVLASMVEGVVALDNQERILHLNDAAGRLLGGRAETVQGRSVQEVIRNPDLHRMVRTTLAHGEGASNDIALYVDAERVLHTQCTPLLDADGRRMGALLVMHDVTQLRRLETMRTDFAANVSHEIKTPLTAIQGFVETLAQGSVHDPQEVRRFLDIIHKHVRRLGAIIDELMQLANLERGGKMDLQRLDEVFIKAFLEAAVQLCKGRAEEKAIAIVLECPEALTARVDEMLMEQAAVNLLDNAVKYSPSGSRVTVSVEPSEQRIRIHFHDQGIGIAKQHLPRLFERFYRVDKARSRRQGGTGLGLAIVKHIVQAHGGQVSVISEQGKGSTFTVDIPR